MADPADDEGGPPAPAPWVPPETAPPPPPAWGPPPADAAPPPPPAGSPPPPASAPPPGWAPAPSAPPAPTGWGPPAAGQAPPGWGPPPGWGQPLPPLPKGGSSRTGPLPLHPMTVADILDGAFKLLKANARAIITIVAVFVVPLQLLAAWTQRGLFGGAGFLEVFDDPSLGEVGTSGTSSAEATVTFVAGLLNILVLPFLAGAIAQVVGASYVGEEIGAGPALRRTGRRAWALFASWVVVHLLEVAGFIAAAVLIVVAIATGGGGGATAAVLAVGVGLFVGVPVLLGVMALSVAVAPAIVIEELGPMRGVRRSWSLMRRRFWSVLGIALLAGLIAQVLGQILGTVPAVAALLVGLEWGWVLLAAGAILTALVTEPIVAIVATLLYFDARIRFEGFDLQVIASELARDRAPR